MSVLSKPYFHDEAAAFAFVEGVIWPEGPHCRHCGSIDRISAIKPNPEKRVRYGLKKCGECKKQFTVRMGTIFEESKLPLTKWLQAIYLMCASKKGVSAHQLHRTLEVTYKTAWFLAHRIRLAMHNGELAPFGSQGGAVEVDETYIGNVGQQKGTRGHGAKSKVFSLIDRDTGAAKSFVVTDFTHRTIVPIMDAHISPNAHLMTDEAAHYKGLGWNFAAHGTVNHGRDEYVNAENPFIHTNTVEGFYSIFKRGMRGVYQHCSAKHLHRYVTEFDFRYSHRAANGVDDQARTITALQGAVGKRLTYHGPDKRPQA